MWTGAMGSRMSLGGDDSHLYYLYPWRWLVHVPWSLVDNGFSGFNARVFFAPFVALIGVLSWLPFNVQGLAFGLLLAATWTGTAKLVIALLGDRPGARASGQVAASIATLAPVVAATQWSHQLYPVYWLGALPWLVVFVLRHQETGSWRWVWLSVAVTVVLAPAMSALPWTAACLLLAMPLIAVALVARGAALRVSRIFTLAGVTIGANLFWLIPVSASAGGGQVQFAEALSGEGRNAATATVRALAAVQAPRDTVALRVSSKLLDGYDSPARTPNRWSKRLDVLGTLPLSIMVVGTLAAAGRDRRLAVLSGTLTLLWLSFLLLSSVTAVPFGLDAFLWLTRHVPGWSGFRNFYDKFAIPFALAAGVATGVGFASLTATWGRLARVIAATALVGSSVVYGLPLLRGDYFRLPHFGGSAVGRVSDGLPGDYRDMLSAVEELPPGGLLTVPLRVPAWTVVPGSEGAAYVGLSPVNLLTGRSDLNGLDVAPRPLESGITAQLRRAILDEDLPGLAGAVRELGVSYVAVGPPANDALDDRLRLGRTVPAERDLWRRYIDEFAPRSVWRQGDLAIHEIDRAWRTEVLHLSSDSEPDADGPADTTGNCDSDVHWKRLSATRYRGLVPPTRGGCSLILRQAFHPGWHAAIGDRDIASYSAKGFANGFPLMASTTAQEVDIAFRPQHLVPLSFGASAAVLAATGLAWMASGRRRRSMRRG